ncbi:MAG: ribulokinase [Lachnospiraceae bacterium]|nr:ribulokinase [Lachnospiraceae bacterium]
MRKTVIGVDFGTLSARAAAFDIQTGEELASSTFYYPHGCLDTILPDGTPVGINECYQDPADYRLGLGWVIRDVLKKAALSPEEVLAVGTDFTFCTMIPVYEDGTPLSFSEKYRSRSQAYVKLWKHHGAQKEADEINRLAREGNEDFLSWSGGTVSSEYLLPKIWETLNKDPEVFHEAAYMLEAGDWITWLLTGKQVRNRSMAGHRGLYRDGYPSRDFLKALDPALEDLAETRLNAPVLPAGSLAGYVDEKGAALTGLKEGTYVTVSQGDCYTTVPASGVTSPGVMAAVIGTSAVYMVQGNEIRDISGSNGAVFGSMVEGLYGFESGQCCVGDEFSWFTDNMVPWSYEEEARKKGISVFKLLQDKAARLKPGASGVMALDWWNGTRSILMDGELTGMFIGCTLKTTPEKLYRAMVESTAFGARLILDNNRKNGLDISRFIAAGGISYKDPLLMQIYADVLNMPIEVAATRECGALGSAVYALAVLKKAEGAENAYEEAVSALVRPSENRYVPIPEHTVVYEKLYREYLLLHDCFGRDKNSPLKKLLEIKKEALK